MDILDEAKSEIRIQRLYSFFEKYKNNFLTPSSAELIKNPASRSAKLRKAVRTEQEFIYPTEFKGKFKKYIDIENVFI